MECFGQPNGVGVELGTPPETWKKGDAEDYSVSRGRKVRCGAMLGSRLFVSGMVFLGAGPTFAQEALRSNLNAEQAASQMRSQVEGAAYTARWGDLRLLVSPSLGFAWSDNIRLQEKNPQADFLITPQVNLHATHNAERVSDIVAVRFGRGRNAFSRGILETISKHEQRLGWRVGADGWIEVSRSRQCAF